jgi:aspartate/methionine/tyrosine aminotransferase
LFPRVAYLDWAIAHIGRLPFDLASSGMPAIPLHDIATIDPAAFDDGREWLALRAAIARLNAVSEDEVVATLGTAHAVWLAYATVAGPGDEILVEAPTYEPLLSSAHGVGATIVRFDRPAAQNFAVDPARIEERLTDKTRLVVISNLHNPTGVRTSDDVLRRVASMAAARGAHLLVDEVYAPFDTFAGEDGVWPHSARRLGPNVITASSLTKCYGLGSHRFGWMLAPPDIASRARSALHGTCVMLPLAHAHLFHLAVSRIHQLAQRARRLLSNKRSRVEAWLASEHPEITWSRPTEGLFGFATLPHLAATTNLLEVIEQGAREHGVLTSPGAFFEMPNGFRLSWSIDEARLDEALSHLSRVLKTVTFG